MSIALDREGEFVDFDVVREEWNTYELSDETRLRFKFVLVDVFRTRKYDSLGQPVYQFGSTNVVSVRAPPRLRGLPTVPPPAPDDLPKGAVGEVEVRTLQEFWNEYQLKDGMILKVRPVLVGATKTKFFDPLGQPTYIVQSQNVTKVNVPDRLKKKPAGEERASLTG